MTLRGRAEALLVEAVQTGCVDRVVAEGLARDWLAAVGAHAALQVLTGGRFEARAVVEVCEKILAAIDLIRSEEGAGR